jgi:DNA-binding transcriptional MerR regulator
MHAFTIKDLEYLSGIKAHTIRIWEQRYNFLKPRRTITNIRYYSGDELKTLLNIALLNKYGYKISHIDRMPIAELRQKIAGLSDATAQQERVVNELVQEMIDLNMERFEKVLNDYISARGLEKCMIHLVFPFLEKIGILWQAGQIHPAQEHLVSNIIRQKLIVAIETNVTHLKSDKTFLLFLPEGEHHELGLLFIYFLVKSRGAKAIYLGANVPQKDVQFVVACKKPDNLFVHLTGSTGFNFDKFIKDISKYLGSTEIILSGPATLSYRKKTSPNIKFKRSLAEVVEFLSVI